MTCGLTKTWVQWLDMCLQVYLVMEWLCIVSVCLCHNLFFQRKGKNSRFNGRRLREQLFIIQNCVHAVCIRACILVFVDCHIEKRLLLYFHPTSRVSAAAAYASLCGYSLNTKLAHTLLVWTPSSCQQF